MGKSFHVEFNVSDPSLRFYMCRICQNHVALSEDFSLNYTPATGVTGGVFDKVVNVHVNEAEQQRQLGLHTVADVYCNKCENLLGWKFIEVFEEDPVATKDMVMLQMGKLQERNGNQIQQAVEPITNTATGSASS
ncbi:protein yippee-like At4g27740 [Nicotiana tomentosiformis]|uniref:protein yippee-like At4g27740 n=1 Tax=Nicotiana tomentosiformis TaxID=4098 RepID=UPI00051C27E7|nr:protein yippee-like At4g27740 isoform X1 [Nicotiana tomentosiformis]